MPVPKTAKARATRARLLGEAAQLFSVKGYFATTVEDVMAKAGLTKGGFYAHFESKEALARAVVEHAAEMWAAKIVAHVMSFGEPRAQLHAVLDGYRAYAVDRTFEGGCFFVNLSTELDDQNDDLRRLLDDRFEQFRLLVMSIMESGKAAGVFAPDAPSDAVATLVVATLTGTMMLAKSSRRWERFDESNALLTRMITSFEIDPPSSPST